MLFVSKDIPDDLLNVSQLHVRQTGNFNITPVVKLQQKISGDREEGRDLHQHLNRGKNIVILPVGDGLLGDAELAGKLNLTDVVGKP